MDLSHPPFKGTPLVNSFQKLQGPRTLKLLFALRPTLIGLAASFDEQSMASGYRKRHCKQYGSKAKTPPFPLSAILPAHYQTENISIDALTQAAMCHKHARSQSHIHLRSHAICTYHRTRRRDALIMGRQTRYLHHITTTRPAITRASPSREEYLNLVDTYRELYSTQAQWMEPTPPPQFPIFLSSIPAHYVPLPTVRQFLQDSDENFERCKWKEVSNRSLSEHVVNQPLNTGHTQLKLENSFQSHQDGPQQQVISNLLHVLGNARCDHEEAYKAYSKLPSPGVALLSERHIRLLFRRLSTSEKKNPKMALRYLSVVEEMKSQNLPMVQAEWNSAISFCGQCFARIGAREVEDALLTWKQMENDANIKSNNVTFNILFDMAAKAGKFVLADMILKEMDTRGLEYNRFFRVGNIYFNGLRGDGDGVRRAYGELVEAGEIVDTVVMNCVIAALISAGELASAENVFDRMKRLISRHTGTLLPKSRTWQETRNLGRIFDRLARRSRQEIPSKKDQAHLRHLKQQISIMPNIHTFSIFIEHHASQTGDLHRISAILSEMQFLGVTVNSRVFLKLFKGFSKHGQEPLTAWTPHLLKSVWSNLLAAIDEGVEDVSIGKWMVVWVVKAFHHCAGREWALHVWEEFRARQKPDHEELQSVHAILWDILQVDETKPWVDRKSAWRG